MERVAFSLEKDANLIKDVAQYLYPFYANNSYRNENYYNTLVKKYGKKIVTAVIKWEREYGNISHAFSNPTMKKQQG